jgi:hypothetical protein
MSEVIGKIENCNIELAIFAKNNKRNLQISQGENGFIQLDVLDCYKLINEIVNFIKIDSDKNAQALQIQINKNRNMEKTMFQEAVNCERFISSLELLEVPIRLLNL